MLTKPNIDSAAVVARVIALLLRSAGFVMANKSNRFRWTEGFHAHRLGVSRTVIVDYHCQSNDMAALQAKCREEREKARVFLTERGYEFDPAYLGLLYINCIRD